MVETIYLSGAGSFGDLVEILQSNVIDMVLYNSIVTCLRCWFKFRAPPGDICVLLNGLHAFLNENLSRLEIIR